MRGTVDGMPTAFPFASMLPSVLQEDDFVQRWMAAMDDVLVPMIWSLDNFESYLDPQIAPVDFVTWLSSWVGIELDQTWSEPAKRELVSRAVELLKVRGTIDGLRQHVAIYTGGDPEIEESGGSTWSSSPGSALPGSDDARLVVRVRVEDPQAVDLRRLDRIVLLSKPAHLPHSIEVLPA